MADLSPPINPITPALYYTSENQALTRSKVEDFLRDPNLFYRKHIERSVRTKVTDPMKSGTVVDAIFSQKPVPFSEAVTKRADPDLWAVQKANPDLVMGRAYLEAATMLGNFVISQPFYQWYLDKGTDFQFLFQASYQNPASDAPAVDIAGLADAVTIDHDNKIFYLDDLKTTKWQNVKSTKAWWYKCQDSGYFRQLGLYRDIARFMYPGYEVRCRHIVATTDMFGIMRCYFFELQDEDLTRGATEFYAGVDAILSCTDFEPAVYDWDRTVPLKLK